MSNILENQDIKRLDIWTYNYMIHHIDENFTQNRFVITKDGCYLKKYNLCQDTSEWEGWYIEAFLYFPKLLKYSLIKLRRKYIPPLLEKYSEFTILITQDLQNMDLNDVLNYKDYENKNIMKYLETICDSIHSINVVNYRDFDNTLKAKLDSLALDYDTMNFLTTSLNYKGDQTYKLGLKTILKLLKIIKDNFYYQNNDLVKDLGDVYDNLLEDSCQYDFNDINSSCNEETKRSSPK
jgi:hypothetical protein